MAGHVVVGQEPRGHLGPKCAEKGFQGGHLGRNAGIFFVVAKGLRAQRAGRVAPRRGGAKRRAAALGAAQRRKAPPQAAERRAAHKACFSAFNFAPIIENQKMLTGKSPWI